MNENIVKVAVAGVAVGAVVAVGLGVRSFLRFKKAKAVTEALAAEAALAEVEAAGEDCVKDADKVSDLLDKMKAKQEESLKNLKPESYKEELSAIKASVNNIVNKK